MASANDLLTLATTACRAAGAYLRQAERPRDPRSWTAKGRADWATEVDRNSEQLITRILTEGVPGSHVIGEELSPERLPPRAVLAFGTERHGLTGGLLERAERRIAIPMRAGVSSLNLATSVAVTLFTWRLAN